MITPDTRRSIAHLMTEDSNVRVDAPASAQPSWWASVMTQEQLAFIARLQKLDGDTWLPADVARQFPTPGPRREMVGLWLHELVGLGVLDVSMGSNGDIVIATRAGEPDEHQEYVHEGAAGVIPRWDGGTNVTLRMQAADAAHLEGVGLWQLADRMHSALVTLARVRDHDTDISLSDWGRLVRDVDILRAQITAIRAAAIRAHEAVGGTVRGLAADMDVAATTAQRRREAAQDLSRPYSSWVSSSPTSQAPAADADHTVDVVVRRDDEVLFIRRAYPPYRGCLALPGGYVDEGESSLDAAVRELREETGIEVDSSRLEYVGTYDTPGRDPRGNLITTAYVTRVPGDTTAHAGDDAADAQWVPVTDFDIATGGVEGESRLAFDHAEILSDVLRTR